MEAVHELSLRIRQSSDRPMKSRCHPARWPWVERCKRAVCWLLQARPPRAPHQRRPTTSAIAPPSWVADEQRILRVAVASAPGSGRRRCRCRRQSKPGRRCRSEPRRAPRPREPSSALRPCDTPARPTASGQRSSWSRGNIPRRVSWVARAARRPAPIPMDLRRRSRRRRAADRKAPVLKILPLLPQPPARPGFAGAADSLDRPRSNSRAGRSTGPK